MTLIVKRHSIYIAIIILVLFIVFYLYDQYCQIYVFPYFTDKTDANKDREEVNEKLKEVIDENEALRKGMHEILESIRHHDGKLSFIALKF